MARFATVLKSNKHELVAAALEKAILDGELKVGEKLPSEQSLADQFGVSRNIVREALRNVKARGLLDVRNGAGSFIARPTSLDLGNMFNRFIALSDSNINDYYEIRFVLEVKACELAAQRATKEDIARLEAIFHRMEKSLENREELTRLDFDFHCLIAEATKNALFSSLLQPLKSVMTSMFNYGHWHPALEEALHGHRLIFTAMKKRSPKLAAQAMKQHLENSEINLTAFARQNGGGAAAGGARKKTPLTRAGARKVGA